MFVDSNQRTLDLRDEIPALGALAAAVASTFDPREKASLFACRAALERLLASDCVERLVARELAALEGTPEACDVGRSDTRMTLLAGDEVALTLVTLEDGPPGPLFGAPRTSL